MSTFQSPPHELHPHKLNSEEITNPYKVIQDFFDYGHLPELRELLWHWLKTTVMGNYSKGLNRNERFDVINMYEHVEKLIEAVHIIHVNRGGWARSAAGNDNGVQPGSSSEKNLVSLITLTVQPESIFSFTPAAERSAVHLLIVLSNKTQTTFKQAEALIELACINEQQYTCSVIQSAELQQKLTSGHLFYTTVCTYTNRLYHDNAPALPLLPPDQVTAVRATAMQQINNACNKASAFLFGAKDFIQKEEFPVAAFMMQQTAELILRAAIMILMSHEVKTHSISVLLKYTRCCAPQINELFDAPQNKELIPLLDKAYIEARYGSLSITPVETAAMESLVENLLGSTAQYISGIIQSFGKQPLPENE